MTTLPLVLVVGIAVIGVVAPYLLGYSLGSRAGKKGNSDVIEWWRKELARADAMAKAHADRAEHYQESTREWRRECISLVNSQREFVGRLQEQAIPIDVSDTSEPISVREADARAAADRRKEQTTRVPIRTADATVPPPAEPIELSDESDGC